jgi:dimethylhistidine N-methyltransferase
MSNIVSTIARAQPVDEASAAIRNEMAAGLQRDAAFIPPKYFYDGLGSKLFEAICLLDEYHPTRSETEIFRQFGKEIAARCAPGAALIDLGAGNGEKAAKLFPLLRPALYMPVDISGGFLLEAAASLRARFPGLAIHPLIQDFSSGLTLPPELVQDMAKLFFYPGSSLGNFAPLAAQRFLGAIAATGGSLLLGVDIVQDAALLREAYDDPLGVTASFNRNILLNVNHHLGTDFRPRDWAHVAFFNPGQSRVEMHLQATRALSVSWPGGRRDFSRGERIHTENSYKFSRETMASMLRQAGFGTLTFWTDQKGRFLVCHAAAERRG